MLLSELLEERGWTYEEAAAVLNEQGITIRKGERKGAALTAEDLSRRKGSEVPKLWARGFRIESPPPSAESDGGSSGAGRRRNEASPLRPQGAPVVVTPFAERRIAGAYRGIGGIVSTQLINTHGRNAANGVAVAFDKSADPIAALWMRAAEENATIARFVNAMSTGGAVGDLVLAHVVLLATVAYILGAPLPDGAFKSYEQYRVVVPGPARSSGEPGQSTNGKPEDGVIDFTVDSPEGTVVDGSA